MIELELKGKYCKDCVIFSDNLDDDTLSTIYNILDNPAFENQTIRIMPDVHKATDDIVIGFVSTIGDYVCPAHVGSDIGCSISTILFNGTINPEDYPLFDHRIRENIMFGFDLQKKRIFDMKDFFKFIKKLLDLLPLSLVHSRNTFFKAFFVFTGFWFSRRNRELAIFTFDRYESTG